MAVDEWGILPDDATLSIRRREWDNRGNLKRRFSGDRPYPIRFNLRPPTGRQGVADIIGFKEWLNAWRNSPHTSKVIWEPRNYRNIGGVEVPKDLVINSNAELIDFLGVKAKIDSEHWEKVMRPVMSYRRDLYPALLEHLATLDVMLPIDGELLATLLPQLYQGMGEGRFLRGVSLSGVDTKFLEKFKSLVVSLLDVIHGGAVSSEGGLESWLGCSPAPRGWLTVRPLCQEIRMKMGGIPLLMLDQEYLRETGLPADKILVVENKESGLALPELPGVVAVFGGGKNVSWMSGGWLIGKEVAYWGDIDTWGMDILSHARDLCPHVRPLMMTEEVLDEFSYGIAKEEESVWATPLNLTADELALYERLSEMPSSARRLEQERLPSVFVEIQLKAWNEASFSD
jgi:hypothetical protein